MKCICNDEKFCKRCYSILYYKLNRQEILQQQKIKYKEKKCEKHYIKINRGNFLLSFK